MIEQLAQELAGLSVSRIRQVVAKYNRTLKISGHSGLDKEALIGHILQKSNLDRPLMSKLLKETTFHKASSRSRKEPQIDLYSYIGERLKKQGFPKPKEEPKKQEEEPKKKIVPFKRPAPAPDTEPQSSPEPPRPRPAPVQGPRNLQRGFGIQRFETPDPVADTEPESAPEPPRRPEPTPVVAEDAVISVAPRATSTIEQATGLTREQFNALDPAEAFGRFLPLLAKKNLLGLKVASEDPETGTLVSKKTSKPLQVGGPEGRPVESAEIVIRNLENTVYTLETLQKFGRDTAYSPKKFIDSLKTALPVLKPETYASIEELAKIFPGEEFGHRGFLSSEFAQSIKSIKKGTLLWKDADYRPIAEKLADLLHYRFSAQRYNRYEDKTDYMLMLLKSRIGTPNDKADFSGAIRYLQRKIQQLTDYMKPAIEKINESTAKYMKSKNLLKEIEKYKNKDKIEAERIEKVAQEKEELRQERQRAMYREYKLLSVPDRSIDKNTHIIVYAKNPNDIVQAKPLRLINKQEGEVYKTYILFSLANGKNIEVSVPDRPNVLAYLPNLNARYASNKYDMAKFAEKNGNFGGMIKINDKVAKDGEETGIITLF